MFEMVAVVLCAKIFENKLGIVTNQFLVKYLLMFGM